MPSICITKRFNPTSFFDRFRLVAAGFLEYATTRADESPIFDDCPTVCGHTGKDARNFCGACPVAAAREAYRDECEIELKEAAETLRRRGLRDGSGFDFEYLERCVIEAQTIKRELPLDRWTIVTARLVHILNAEQNRRDRARQWNESQRAKEGAI